jgi:hypothetical protein
MWMTTASSCDHDAARWMTTHSKGAHDRARCVAPRSSSAHDAASRTTTTARGGHGTASRTTTTSSGGHGIASRTTTTSSVGHVTGSRMTTTAGGGHDTATRGRPLPSCGRRRANVASPPASIAGAPFSLAPPFGSAGTTARRDIAFLDQRRCNLLLAMPRLTPQHVPSTHHKAVHHVAACLPSPVIQPQGRLCSAASRAESLVLSGPGVWSLDRMDGRTGRARLSRLYIVRCAANAPRALNRSQR